MAKWCQSRRFFLKFVNQTQKIAYDSHVFCLVNMTGNEHFYRGFSKHLYSEVWFQPVIWEEYNVDFLGFISRQLLVAATFFVPSKWNETFLARTVKHHSSKVWLQLVQQFQRRWLIEMWNVNDDRQTNTKWWHSSSEPSSSHVRQWKSKFCNRLQLYEIETRALMIIWCYRLILMLYIM